MTLTLFYIIYFILFILYDLLLFVLYLTLDNQLVLIDIFQTLSLSFLVLFIRRIYRSI